MTESRIRRQRKFATNSAIRDAVVLGLQRAERLSLTKPHDVALSVEMMLRDAGFRIIKKSNYDPTDLSYMKQEEQLKPQRKAPTADETMRLAERIASQADKR